MWKIAVAFARANTLYRALQHNAIRYAARDTLTTSRFSHSDETWNALLEFETRDLVFRRYKERHGRELSSGRLRAVASSFIQAREYYQAASTAGVTVKPVLLFYGVQALSRGLILFLSKNAHPSSLKPSHGLDTKGWRETLGGDVERLGDLTVVVQDGVFYELLRATNGGAYLRANSTAVNWHFTAELPPLGFTFTLTELVQKIPDLPSAFFTWKNASVPSAFLDSVLVDSTTSTLAITLRGEVAPEVLHRLFPNDSCGSVSGIPKSGSTLVTVPATCQPFYAQLFEGAFAIGDVVLIPPFSSGQYLSPLAVYYAASFMLGMFARYFPAEWVGLANFTRGDAALPLIKRLLQLIEAVYPELALTFLRGPYSFERSTDADNESTS